MFMTLIFVLISFAEGPTSLNELPKCPCKLKKEFMEVIINLQKRFEAAAACIGT